MSRLIICSPTFWPEPVGTPRYATDAARWFSDQGWDVEVVTSQPFYPDFCRQSGWGRSRRIDDLDGIPIHRLPTIVPPGGRTLGRIIGDANFSLQVLASGLLRRLPRPDAVLSFSPGVPLVVPAARGFRSRGPHVTVVHDIASGLAEATGLANGKAVSIIRRLERAALSDADHRVALSDAMVDSMVELGVEGSTSVVPIWVDVPVADSTGTLKSDGFALSYSGNLGRKQGIPMLLDSFAELSADGVAIQVRGRGVLRALAEQRIASMPHVALLDYVPSDILSESLRSADLHLVPQGPRTESYSMPSKVLNIFASGRPMLAICEAGGPLHQLTEKGLAIWSPPDPARVAAAVRMIRDHPTEALERADRARQYVAQHHQRHHLLGRIEQKLRP